MTKVLFLVSSPGQGHTRCAQAIDEALARYGQEFKTDLLDIHDLVDDRVSEAIVDGYLRMTAENPALYQRLYDMDKDLYRQLSGEIPADRTIADFLTEQQQRWFPEFAARDWLTSPRRNLDRALINTLVNGVRQSRDNPPNRLLMRGLLHLIYRILARRLREAVIERQPDVLVATQMYPNALLGPARVSGQLSLPLIGVITDYGVHGAWVRDTTDYYCVGHDDIARQLQAREVARERIFVTGIPLMPDFADPISQQEARERLALPSRPTVLVTGGEYGVGTREAVQRLVREPRGPTILVTGAHHSRDLHDLEELAHDYPERLHVYDWSDRMSLLMRAADVVAGKPGGLTVSESLASGRPFLATCCLGGQEGHNVSFLEQQKVGRRLEPDALSDFLQSLCARPGALRAWQDRVARAGRRRGARAVAELIHQCTAGDSLMGVEDHADSP